MAFCQEQTIKASSSFGEVAAPIKCRSWLCENCWEWRQRQLQARCIEGKPNRFLTITCRAGEFGSKEANAKAIAQAWRTAVLHWRRLNKWHKCEYICVFEPHTSGWPHLHVLWKGHWIDQKWLSEQMRAILNSPVVHVSLIKDAKSAAYYVAKYFSKAPTKFGTAKRYWTSGNWPKCEPTDAPKVFRDDIPTIRVNETVESIVREWKRWGKEVWQFKGDIYGWGIPWNPGTYLKANRDKPIRSYDGDLWRKTHKGWIRA